MLNSYYKDYDITSRKTGGKGIADHNILKYV